MGCACGSRVCGFLILIDYDLLLCYSTIMNLRILGFILIAVGVLLFFYTPKHFGVTTHKFNSIVLVVAGVALTLFRKK